MSWVYPRVGLGWVGLGWEWVENFCFYWVGLGHGSEMACLRKQMSSTSYTYVTLCCQAIILLRENLHLHLLSCVRVLIREPGTRLFLFTYWYWTICGLCW